MFSKLAKTLTIPLYIQRQTYHHMSLYLTSAFHDSNFLISNLNYKYNLSYNDIRKDELKNKEGILTDNNVYSIDTGKFNGRSPKDKYIVKQFPSKNEIWWGSVNKPMNIKVFNKLKDLCIEHYNNNVHRYYIFDGYCGSDKKSQKKVRFVTESAWQHHFVKNMFIESNRTDMNSFIPDITVINACKITNPDWKEQNLHSENFICLNIEKKLMLIGGTHYGGEMKKGIFSLMNYLLPKNNILSMHCSANINKYGDTTLFFGLSGTGKTTLSATHDTFLIGDDEHGWNNKGIFNLEGGCYAKTLNLNKESEPLIYNAIKKNALLENIMFNPKTKTVDYDNKEKTENGRVSYPLEHLPNIVKKAVNPHPKNIIFLCCDMYGVLPPVAQLTKEQSIYYFLSGYTSKISGTERENKLPEATFSPCFGGAFLTLPPEKYGDLLYKKINEHDCNIYLVNTGWYGGSYGKNGKRYPIETTRKIIKDIMSNSISNKKMKKDENFNFMYPTEYEPDTFWKNKNEFKRKKKELVSLFCKNYKYNSFSEFGPSF